MIRIEIRAPYLIFLGHEKEITYAKTGAGMVQWRPELCAGQISLAKDGLDLGLEDMTPKQAADAGIKSLIIGTAAIGGGIPDPWLDLFEQVAELGIDIEADGIIDMSLSLPPPHPWRVEGLREALREISQAIFQPRHPR